MFPRMATTLLRTSRLRFCNVSGLRGSSGLIVEPHQRDTPHEHEEPILLVAADRVRPLEWRCYDSGGG